VGTSEGVIKVRTVRRQGNAGTIWVEESMSVMKGTPWEPVPGREGVEVMSKVELPPAPVEVPPMADGPKWEQDWRRPKIERRDVRNLGMTPGCPGCVAANRGSAARRHTEECRKRMETGMGQAGDPRIDRYNQRIVEASRELLKEREEKKGTGAEKQEAEEGKSFKPSFVDLMYDGG
jgi:hypothetical protein